MKKLRYFALSMLAALSLAASAQTTTPNPVTLTLDIHECYVHETMTTTDKTAYYYVSYLEKEIFEEKGYNDDETLASEDKKWFEEMAKGYQMDVKDVVQSFGFKGDAAEYQAGLLPDREYVIWYHGVDEKGNTTTEIKRLPFRTKPVQTISNRIKLKAQKTNDGGIFVTCEPDDKNLYYTFGSIAKSNMFDEFTHEELTIRDYMQTGISTQIYDYLASEEFGEWFKKNANQGDFFLKFDELVAGEEYYIVAAYVDNEAGICSEIATVEIDGEGNPTGINSVKNNTTLVADGVYTLDGTRVGTTLGDVQRGAYIVKFNGRTHKVVKK
ncbi:hypothetical protein [Leyella stercorea]|uniref:hypothetical protein n=1 Tax=Leyella stercorea TaxID=363265 RepID=UPI003A914DB0